jgi:hypothetical protein
VSDPRLAINQRPRLGWSPFRSGVVLDRFGTHCRLWQLENQRSPQVVAQSEPGYDVRPAPSTRRYLPRRSHPQPPRAERAIGVPFRGRVG